MGDKVAIITLTAEKANMHNADLVRELQQAIMVAQEMSGNFMKWKIEKITVLEDA